MDLDNKDKKIIEILKQDSRQSIRELAKHTKIKKRLIVISKRNKKYISWQNFT